MQKILDMFRKRRNDIRKPIEMDKRVVNTGNKQNE